jgi:hypothetical protein
MDNSAVWLKPTLRTALVLMRRPFNVPLQFRVAE